MDGLVKDNSIGEVERAAGLQGADAQAARWAHEDTERCRGRDARPGLPCNQHSSAAWSRFPASRRSQPYCLVDKVVGMEEEDIGNGKSVIQLPVPDESHGGDNADALFPKGPATTGQLIQQATVLLWQQPFPQQRIANSSPPGPSC